MNLVLDLDTFVGNFLLEVSDGTVGDPVVDCQGEMVGYLTQKLDVVSTKRIGLQAGEPKCTGAPVRRVRCQPAKGSISQLKAPQFLCRYCTSLISITVRYLKRLLMLKDAPKQGLFHRDVFTGLPHGGAMAPQYFAPVFGVEDDIEKIEVK